MEDEMFVLCMTIAGVGIVIFTALCELVYELCKMNESKKKPE